MPSWWFRPWLKNSHAMLLGRGSSPTGAIRKENSLFTDSSEQGPHLEIWATCILQIELPASIILMTYQVWKKSFAQTGKFCSLYFRKLKACGRRVNHLRNCMTSVDSINQSRYRIHVLAAHRTCHKALWTYHIDSYSMLQKAMHVDHKQSTKLAFLGGWSKVEGKNFRIFHSRNLWYTLLLCTTEVRLASSTRE